MNKKENEFITFLGIPLSYDTLRGWVRCPFTLDQKEKHAYKSFIESHHIGLGPFGWFFEYHWSMGELARTEVKRLIDFVDKLEGIHIMFTCNDVLYLENHLRYIVKQLLDEGDGPEFFEVFRDFRTGKTKLNIDYYPEEED